MMDEKADGPEWRGDDDDLSDIIAGLEVSTLESDKEVELLENSNIHNDPEKSGCQMEKAVSEFMSNSDSDGASLASSGFSEHSGGPSDASAGMKFDSIWMEDTTKDVRKEEKPVKQRRLSFDESCPQPRRKTSLTKNPIKRLQKMLSKQELVKSETPSKTDIGRLQIDTLPQHFVIKFLGSRPTTGIQGLKHIRRPIDEMVKTAADPSNKFKPPLVQLTVWDKGVQTSLHPKTSNTDFQPIIMPIEFISYAVQDVKYHKIVSFILVTEISAKTRKVECHAYICDSPITARKITLSVAKAFETYAKTMDLANFKFQVDLRTPDEHKDEMRRKSLTMKECDA